MSNLKTTWLHANPTPWKLFQGHDFDELKDTFRREKNSCPIYILLTSARSRWLDIGQVLFMRFYGPQLDRTRFVNKGLIIWITTPSCRFVFLLLYLPVFVEKCVLETQFCFLRFQPRWRSVFSFSNSIPTEKSQRIFFRSRKIFCEKNLRAAKRAIPSGQYRTILPALVANHSTAFDSSLMLTELVI